ncbi:MAG: hypothetical protein GX660_25615 [Clostridiaceae bacterium]|nr:hypothetical protein [Clostridiaceae bacterium]
MNKFITKINNSVNKAGFKLQKHSPEILVVVGVIGTITSAVMACKATTKLSGILEEAGKTIEQIHEYENKSIEISEKTENYTAEAAKKDLALTYLQTGIKVVKLYAPSVILGTFSMGCMIKSNDILRKRNVALAAAYATISQGFKEYRNRVIERFGKELDHELKHNIKVKTIEKTVVDGKGKEKTVKEEIIIAGDPNEYSEYARFFDEGSPHWEKNAEYNLMFLKAQQAYANDKLKAKGRLFLNEVYDMLGIPETKAGQVVGWVYDPENPSGDNYVDFGIYDIHRERARDFVNGYEKAILLDFNVDGNVWESM